MPDIGEIRQARDIGYLDTGKYIWAACIGCGKERWVAFRGTRSNNGQPRSLRCLSCKISSLKGKNSINWRGGRFIYPNGYVTVYLESSDFFYPMTNGRRYIYEHRLVMAKHIGRCLHSWEIVHHKNGVRDDNRIENLELSESNGAHIREHTEGYKDGFKKGYFEGRNTRMKELENRIRKLEAKERPYLKDCPEIKRRIERELRWRND